MCNGAEFPTEFLLETHGEEKHGRLSIDNEKVLE
jgi:hypothetical protein